jgi:hypothetical protein
MANSEELICTAEYMTLYKRCRINRRRSNRVLLYFYKSWGGHMGLPSTTPPSPNVPFPI